MTYADQIKCLTPTTDAIKDKVLYCSTPGLVDNVAFADAMASWVDAAINIGLLATAIVAAILGLQQLRIMAQDSFDRTRPYVSIKAVPGLAGSGFFDLIVENSGGSAARKIRGSFVGLSETKHIDNFRESAIDTFAEGFSLVPGERHRIWWQLNVPEGKTWSMEPHIGENYALGMPSNVGLTIEYENEKGHKFTDTVDINIEPLKNSPATDGGKEAPKELNKKEMMIFDSLRDLNSSLKEIRR